LDFGEEERGREEFCAIVIFPYEKPSFDVTNKVIFTKCTPLSQKTEKMQTTRHSAAYARRQGGTARIRPPLLLQSIDL